MLRLFSKWSLLVLAWHKSLSALVITGIQAGFGKKSSMCIAIFSWRTMPWTSFRCLVRTSLAQLGAVRSNRSLWPMPRLRFVASILCIAWCHTCCDLLDVQRVGGGLREMEGAPIPSSKLLYLLLQRSGQCRLRICQGRLHSQRPLFSLFNE